MNAPERILKAVNHEEPDRVPAFESAFTNNTIMAHYGVKIKSMKVRRIPDSLVRKGAENKSILRAAHKNLYKFSH